MRKDVRRNFAAKLLRSKPHEPKVIETAHSRSSRLKKIRFNKYPIWYNVFDILSLKIFFVFVENIQIGMSILFRSHLLLIDLMWFIVDSIIFAELKKNLIINVLKTSLAEFEAFCPR